MAILIIGVKALKSMAKTIEIFGKKFGVVEGDTNSSCECCALHDFCNKVNDLIDASGQDWNYPTICSTKNGRDRYFVYLPNS